MIMAYSSWKRKTQYIFQHFAFGEMDIIYEIHFLSLIIEIH